MLFNKTRCKDRRVKLKAQGLCTDCGKEPLGESIARCPDCLHKLRINSRRNGGFKPYSGHRGRPPYDT